MRTVSVLIVGCPCALILATPTAMVAAMGGLARRGILVRGGTVLQEAAKLDTFLFDKTGTVTEGRFEIVKLLAAGGASEEELLRLAGAAERGSDHVLARVIVEAARERGAELPEPEEARIVPGRGARGVIDGREVRAGNRAFVEEAGVQVPREPLEEADRMGATAVFVAEGGEYRGAILLRDRIRAGVHEAVHELEDLEISRIVMLTGDRRRAAEAIAREAGIETVEADLLPEEKLERVKRWSAEGRRVAMVGDGVNDAPALAAAAVGIAVKGASDITAEAADVVYLGQSLEKLPRLVEVARKAVAIAWQNIIGFAVIVNAVAIGLASAGKMGPLGAAFTHQIASFLVMLNALRLLEVEDRGVGRLRRRLADWIEYGWPREFVYGAKLWLSRVEPGEWWRWLRGNWRSYWKPALAGLTALVLLNGLYTIEPHEAGVIERFGRKSAAYRGPGLHYKLPWPVEKLTRVETKRARAIEIGFRSAAEPEFVEPPAYEWSAQHRSGRFQRRPEEALMLTGDQNLIELTAVVHYRISKPDDFLFRHMDGAAVVRTAAESVLQGVVTRTELDGALTVKRREIEDRVAAELQQRLDRYQAGAEVLRVRLIELHPAVEVVDAFREVSGAFEEKNRLVNEAEGYRNEQVALARGRAEASLRAAAGYAAGRKARAAGDAGRFEQFEAAFRQGPQTTETRLYLETMEQILPGKRKMIVDATRARRHLLLMEDGVELAPGLAAAGRPAREEER